MEGLQIFSSLLAHILTTNKQTDNVLIEYKWYKACMNILKHLKNSTVH